ncbi:MAG TPA: DUF2341 domain-containing protein [Geminicoccus sp.]|uniref:DUF2341 domain-containing protein n=1 Tax=Geminicoccus sp. TaxID=2024832 RepID=UPI002CA793AE|nr:DUF2341 domain-containing protein [Geminicoccus sp.]HWL67502.1 DUF2341 domain-containing protein [Geminicoccus sp.]
MPIARPDHFATQPGQPVTIAPFANDEGVSLTFLGFSSPANGTVAPGPAANTLIYTPQLGFSGVDQFTYTVGDTTGETAQAVVTITVSAANLQPVANDDAAATAPGTLVNIDVLANDQDPDGDPLQLGSISMPGHGSITAHPDMSVTYQPELGFTGVDRFTYTVIDGQGGSDSAEVTITVAGVNLPPVANDDQVTTGPGQPVLITVLTNDSDGNGDPLQLSGIAMPANGTVSIDGLDRLLYTPATGFTGTDQFTYTITDGQGGTATGRVTVQVQASNTAPVATADSVTTYANTPVTIPLLANDTDVDGDTIRLIALTVPSNGTVAVDGQQRVVYTPAAGFTGTDGFTYRIADSRGGESSGTVTVQVQVQPAPSAYSNGYRYRRRLVVPRTSLTGGSLTDFPMLVELSGNWLKHKSASNGRLESPAGLDLRFETAPASGSGVKLDHEVEAYNGAAGTLRAWVRMPSLLTTADTTIYLYYGKEGVALSEENAAGVWKDYLAVYHLPVATDRTGRGRDLAVKALGTGSLIGAAGDFNGTDSEASRESPTFLDALSAYTVQAWIKADQVGSDRGIVSVGPITGRDDAMGFCLRYDKAGHSGGGTNVILLEQQLTSGRTRIETASDVQRTGAQFLAVTWQQNGNPQIWIDAEANTPSYETSVRNGTTSFSNGPLRIGRASFDASSAWDGAIDEVRLRASALPENWLKAEYLNHRRPGAFYGLGGEDAFGTTNQAPVAVPNRVATSRNTAITIDVLANDIDPESGTRSLVSGQVGTPANGTAVISAGKVVYTPATGFVGEDAFTYTMQDAQNQTSVGTVVVEVAQPAAPTNDDKPYRGRLFGCAIHAEAVGNTRYGYGKPAAFRFAAERSGQITSLRYFLRYDQATGHVGYSIGNGGTIRIELRTNDPATGFPTNTVLAKTANLTNLMNSDRFAQIPFLAPYPVLTAGEIYHLVFLQLDSSGKNEISVNMLHTKMPIPTGGTGRMGPFHGDALAHLWVNNSGGWYVRTDRCPIFEIYYADGMACGVGWMFAHDSGDKQVGGSLMARQRLPMLDESRSVNGVWLRVRKSGGSPSDLICQLIDASAGTILEDVRIPPSQVVTSTRYDVAVPWQFRSFSQPRLLTKGKTYHMRFSATSGNYWFGAAQRGTAYGFKERNIVPSAYAEYSVNGGSSWSGWSFTSESLGTHTRTDMDLPVALQTI